MSFCVLTPHVLLLFSIHTGLPVSSSISVSLFISACLAYEWRTQWWLCLLSSVVLSPPDWPCLCIWDVPVGLHHAHSKTQTRSCLFVWFVFRTLVVVGESDTSRKTVGSKFSMTDHAFLNMWELPNGCHGMYLHMWCLSGKFMSMGHENITVRTKR